MKYKEGEEVHVRLSGLIVPGTIKSVTKNGEYIVRFDGGSKKTVLEKHIKKVSSRPADFVSLKSRSPSRRSPSRRSPSERKSSLTQHLPKMNKTQETKTAEINIPNDFSDAKILLRRLDDQEEFADYMRQRKVNLSVNSLNKSVAPPNESFSKFKETVSVHTTENESDNVLSSNKFNVDYDRLSDDDISDFETKKFDIRKSEQKYISPPREFCGWFGALMFITILPFISFSLHLICNQNSCTFSNIPNFKIIDLTIYLDPKIFAAYIIFLIVIIFCSLIPFVGKKVTSICKDNIIKYRMNGLFTAFFSLSIIMALDYQKIKVIQYLYENYMKIMVTTILLSYVFSLLLFIKSKFVTKKLLNPYAITHNFLYDFFAGREINPRILGCDIKIILIRASYINILIINFMFAFKSISKYLNDDYTWSWRLDDIIMDRTILACSFLQIFYVLDFLYFEHQLTTTFELQYEGLGCMKTLSYSLQPFLLTLTTKYLFEHQVNIPYWMLLTSVVLFFIGYYIYRASNTQKYAFRVNPYGSVSKHLETLLTGQSKKLIISGWWGRLRHPNYTGDILMQLALAGMCCEAPASFGVLISTIMLIIRAKRDSNRCRRRYGFAWEYYTSKVRYTIFPFIY